MLLSKNAKNSLKMVWSPSLFCLSQDWSPDLCKTKQQSNERIDVIFSHF
jgi:hypothetical protein